MRTRRNQILTLADLDEALRDADVDLQAHVYDVLDLEVRTGTTTDEEVKRHVRSVLGDEYPDEQFTPGALSVWRTTMAAEALAEDLQERRPERAALHGPDLRLTIMGQIAADTAARFMKTSVSAGKRSGR
jgi:hypothetical protein